MSLQTQTLRRSEVIQWELEPRYTFVRPSWVGSSLDEAPAVGIPLKIIGGYYDLAVAGDESTFVAISDGQNVISRPPVAFKKSGLLSAWESIAGWDDDTAIDRLLSLGYQILNATGLDPVVAPAVTAPVGEGTGDLKSDGSIPMAANFSLGNNDIIMVGLVDGRDVSADGATLDALGTAATLNADTSVLANAWVLDENDMVSDSESKLATQQSIKAYVDTLRTYVDAGSAAGGRFLGEIETKALLDAETGDNTLDRRKVTESQLEYYWTGSAWALVDGRSFGATFPDVPVIEQLHWLTGAGNRRFYVYNGTAWE